MPQEGELRQRTLSFAKKALELSQEVGIPRYTTLSHWAAIHCDLLFTGKVESALKHAGEMLRQGKIARDNYLKGVASYLLTFAFNWKVQREEDPEKSREDLKKIIEHAENAIRSLQLVSQDFFTAETEG